MVDSVLYTHVLFSANGAPRREGLNDGWPAGWQAAGCSGPAVHIHFSVAPFFSVVFQTMASSFPQELAALASAGKFVEAGALCETTELEVRGGRSLLAHGAHAARSLAASSRRTGPSRCTCWAW